MRSTDNQAPSSLILSSMALQQQQQQHEQHQHQQLQPEAGLGQNESSAISDIRRPQQANKCGGEEALAEPLSKENAELLDQLAHYYKFDSNESSHDRVSNKNLAPTSQTDRQPPAFFAHELLELPRPSNVTVLIISWYPPVLKLSWSLNELDKSDSIKLDFYGQLRTNGSVASGEFDLDLALGKQNDSEPPSSLPPRGSDQAQDVDRLEELADEELRRTLEGLKRRRLLLKKSLTCFQVTYNAINSRFKVTEEYPPYLRSVLLERLQPATEYSLRVGAIYLNKIKRISQRVQFISPTDNESRRFKENTYRPVHSYPDEKGPVKIGLAQVRNEELTIVGIALIFWIATIYLFFNKWGKIRMLEPYQPAYREVASSAASFAAAHHHPSAHTLHQQLGQTSTARGSGASAASGAPLVGAMGATTAAKISSLCISLGAATCPGEPLCEGHHLAAADDTIKSGSATGTTQPPNVSATLAAHNKRDSEGALTNRKSSNSLLALGRRRFGTLTDERPTLRHAGTSELNYLFQSKAAALAKASLLWPTTLAPSSQQKLKQDQYKTRLASQVTDFETIRQMSKCLAARRGFAHRHGSSTLLRQQRQQVLATDAEQQIGLKQQQSLLKRSFESSTGSIKGSASPTASLVSHHKPIGLQQQAVPPTTSTGRRANLSSLGRVVSATSGVGHMLRYTQRNDAIDYANLSPNSLVKAVTQSLDQATHDSQYGTQLTSDARAGGGTHEDMSRRANKLRRLQFINKLHQRQQVATSASSSTLAASISKNNDSPANSVPKLTSLSLDNEQVAGVAGSYSRQRSGATSDQLTGRHMSSASLGKLELEPPGTMGVTKLRQVGAPSETGAGPNGPPKSADTGDEQASAQKTAPSCLRLDPKVARTSPVEHHILIEPPSPPSSSKHELASDPKSRSVRPAACGHDQCEREHNGQPAALAAGRRASLIEMGAGERAGHIEWRGQVDQSEPLVGRLANDVIMGRSGATECDVARQQAGGLEDECRYGQETADIGESQPRLCVCGELTPVRHGAGGAARNLDAFAKLASTYQASAERRSRQLGAAGGPFARPTSVQCACQQQLGTCADRQAASGQQHQQRSRHQSFCAGERAPGRRAAEEQQQAGGGGQARPCSLCGLAECATKQAAAQAVQMAASYQQRQLAAATADGQTQQGWPTGRRQPAPPRGVELAGAALEAGGGARPRMSSVFVASPYTRAHRDSFAMLRALSQKKYKSAEDVAYLSSLVLQIWTRDSNPLLQSVSSQQLNERNSDKSHRRQSAGLERRAQPHRKRPKSSLQAAQL